MPRRFRLLSLLLALSTSPGLSDEGFVPLFPDRSFSGWKNVNCAPSTWSFDEEGILICTGRPIGEIRTERMYQNFILELEWRHLVRKGNAGVFVWADDITAKGQPFIRGIEIQVLENAYGNTKSYTTHGDIFPIHGAKMNPTNGRGGMRSFPTKFLSRPSPEWNHYRIECHDGTIKLRVNGTEVNEGRDCLPRKGYLCLESEGGVVHYRNVRIKELPDTPVSAEETAIADRGYEVLYNGVDLSGWQRSSDAWKARDWNLVFEGPTTQEQHLVCHRSLGGVELLFDVRFLPESGVLSFYPRGLSHEPVLLDPAAPALRDRLAKRGGWNRFEVTRTGEALVLRVNGDLLLERNTASPHAAPEPIAFSTRSPLEMANFYARDESGKK